MQPSAGLNSTKVLFMDIKYLPGQLHHCNQIANWINSIGYGHIEYLFDNLIPSRTALQQIALVLQQDEHYSYKNVDLAIDNNHIIGLVFSYIADANVVTAEMEIALSKDRIRWLQYFTRYQINNSWYINALGVEEKYRRQGIAKQLIACASQRALQNGFQRLSLHVYEGNTAAIKLYEACGFVVVKKIALTGHPFFEARNLSTSILMQCNLSDLVIT